jgi:hypothetical protein
MLPLRYDDYIGQEIDDELDTLSCSDTHSLFDSSDNKDDTDLESSVSEVESNDDDNLFDDEIRRPPEFYLAASANLDVGRLRQKRYSPKTQGRLDWAKGYFD